jgi:hypothetical protein
MSGVSKVRESVDSKLARLDARADAFQAALEGANETVDERLGRHKKELQLSLDRLTADINNRKDLSATGKQAIHSEVDNLNQQIALSDAASHETLAYARRQIHQAIQKLETAVDGALAESKNVTEELLHASLGAYARAADKFDAELEAAELRLASARDKSDAAFAKRRQELAQELVRFKQRLGEKKAHASDKLANFEAELRGGFEHIAKSLKDLFR